MDSRRALAKMTVRVPAIGERGSTDRSSIDFIDVAMACAGLDRGPYLLALTKYADMRELINQLNDQLFFTVIKKYDRSCTNTIIKLCKLAVIEHVVSPKCSNCDGTEIMLDGGTIVECDVCAGSGLGQYTIDQRASACSLATNDWADRWATAYADISGVLDKWHARALGHIHHKLNDDDSLTN